MLTASMSLLPPATVAVAGLNEAVTPVGTPEEASVTELVNPFWVVILRAALPV